MNVRFFAVFTAVLCSATVFGQSVSISTRDLAYRLISPNFLGGATHLTRTDTPHSTYLNPAAAAGYQRIIFDVNYANLQKLAGSSGMGHSLNIALSVPTKKGVVTGNLGLLDTSAYVGTIMDLGISGHLNLTFSKKIYSDVWFGLGIVGDIGRLDGLLQGGGALDLGFLHYPDNIWNLKNFSWGVTLSGLGYRFGSASRGYFNAIPGNLTAAAGFAFDIVEQDTFQWTLRADLRTPSFTDLSFGVTNELRFGSHVSLSVASSLTLLEALAGSWKSLIPSAMVGVNFALNNSGTSKENKYRTTELGVQLAAAQLQSDVWGFAGGVTLPLGVKDIRPPVVTVEEEFPQYFSPNYDGVQDNLLIPYLVSDERYISGYVWWVVDSTGKTVRRYINKDERPENESVKNLFERLISSEEGTLLPANFRWNGVNEDGSIAPDGNYSVYLEFTDDNGNIASVGPFSVVLDTFAPQLDIQIPQGPDMIFSPDSDGSKDEFHIEQEGSVEDRWDAVFKDMAGNVVKTQTWINAPPTSFVWRGRDDSGEVVADGVYHYSMTATDRAGNFVEGSIDGIILNTMRPHIGLNINHDVFSPGSENAIADILITPNIPVPNGIIGWTLEVFGEDETLVRLWEPQESTSIPEFFIFDGRNDMGHIVPEERYFARLRLRYENGFRSQADSPMFEVDITPPKAIVQTNWSLFSPQSGSRRNTVTFSQTVSDEHSWYGSLVNDKKETIKEWEWRGQPPADLVWDGRDASGRLVPDGRYQYTMTSVDKAGNRGTSVPKIISVDTRAVEASLTASLDVFGPTGNGSRDTVDFFPETRTESPISTWSLAIFDTSKQEIQRWKGEGALPDRQRWDGRWNDGMQVPDGIYTAELTVNYVKGDTARAISSAILVDTRAPEIDISSNLVLFSPDGDGLKDFIIIRQNSSRETRFSAEIIDSEGSSVRQWVWNDFLQDVEWDGSDDSGNLLPDGTYRYVVRSTDDAGNTTEKKIAQLQIDTALTPVYLTVAKDTIQGGAIESENFQSFTVLITKNDSIASWLFAVEDVNGTQVMSESGAGSVPGNFFWNGTYADGQPADGVYKGILIVEYDKGTRPRAESRPFIVDSKPPDAIVTVSPTPFSPDNDNIDDELMIDIMVDDRSQIKEWRLEISDPQGKGFITFSGRGKPSKQIIWDGRSGQGKLVESAEDYPYLFTVTDIIDQTTSIRGRIPVDILVIREGDRLKIRINNITFQPSSPQLTLSGNEGEKNIKVIDRLAEIMNKYNSYRIMVEGHAVSLNWANPSAAKREQEDILIPLSLARAQTVVNELAIRGLKLHRISAVGIGGSKPIVPHSDLEERWRNRRVEFYLDK